MKNELYNGTGCDIIKVDGDKVRIKKPEIGSMIEVIDDCGNSSRMIVDSYFDNKVICDNGGIEACVMVVKRGEALIWKDITEDGPSDFYAEK